MSSTGWVSVLQGANARSRGAAPHHAGKELLARSCEFNEHGPRTYKLARRYGVVTWPVSSLVHYTGAEFASHRGGHDKLTQTMHEKILQYSSTASLNHYNVHVCNRTCVALVQRRVLDSTWCVNVRGSNRARVVHHRCCCHRMSSSSQSPPTPSQLG